MGRKPTKRSEAEFTAIREAMASTTKMERTAILKRHREAIANAPGDLGPVPEEPHWMVTCSPVDDKGNLLPMPRRGPKSNPFTISDWLSGQRSSKKVKKA